MGSILGFSTSSSPRRIGVRTYRVPGTKVDVPVRSEVAPLLIGFLTEYHRTVEPLVRGWCWGYAYRAIRDSFLPSRHSAGIAVDFNAPRHPLGADPRRSFSDRQIAQIRALSRKYGLRWGGDYRGRKDGMHVEINESRSAALARVKRLQNQPPPAPKPKPVAGEPGSSHFHTTSTVKMGTRGHDTRDVQGHLNYWRAKRRLSKMAPDGVAGKTTVYCIEVFQQAYGLKRDGICGPKTYALLHRETLGHRLESDGRGF